MGNRKSFLKVKISLLSRVFLLGALLFLSSKGFSSEDKDSNQSVSDPTRPFFSTVVKKQKAKEKPLVLQAILSGENRKQAIINNELYNLGDSVQGKHLQAIQKRKVVLTSGGSEWVLVLRPRILFESEPVEKFE